MQVNSLECEVYDVEFGAESAECRKNVEYEVQSAKYEVPTVKCSVKCGAWSLQWGVRNEE